MRKCFIIEKMEERKEKSKKKTKKSDPDFIPEGENEEIRLELPKEMHIVNDRVFLLYKSKMRISK